MVSKNKKSKNSLILSKPLLLGVILVLLIAGGSYALFSNSKAANDSDGQGGTVTVEPKDDEDKSGVDENVPEDQDGGGPADKKAVVPTIGFSGVRNNDVDVRSLVTEVYESTGKCTATFKKGTAKIVRTVEGIKDASYTRCDRVVVPVSEFNSSGGWTVTITYSSPSAYGVSEPSEVTGL